MQEFIDKLIGRLEEYEQSHLIEHKSEQSLHCKEVGDCRDSVCALCVWDKAKEIIKKLAGEHNNGYFGCNSNGEHEKCEDCGMNGRCANVNKHWFGNSSNNNGWISVNDRLPEDCDNRFYMCIVENHEEDLPMFCQYDEEYGFGFWHDIYDEHTLGFVDSEFRTNEELGYEKVIAWQSLPPSYKEN